MDILISQDRTRRVTSPSKIKIQPGSYLRFQGLKIILYGLKSLACDSTLWDKVFTLGPVALTFSSFQYYQTIFLYLFFVFTFLFLMVLTSPGSLMIQVKSFNMCSFHICIYQVYPLHVFSGLSCPTAQRATVSPYMASCYIISAYDWQDSNPSPSISNPESSNISCICCSEHLTCMSSFNLPVSHMKQVLLLCHILQIRKLEHVVLNNLSRITQLVIDRAKI